MGKFYVHVILCELVFFMNHVFWNKIKWLERQDLAQLMISFKKLCSLLVHQCYSNSHFKNLKPTICN